MNEQTKMNTEKLNEYIFAKLVADQAQLAWKARRRSLESAGASDADISNMPLTKEDLQKGFEMLEWYRLESLKVLQESLAAPPK